MNNIKNPLIVSDSFEHNYPKGSYVDLELAQEMLKALEIALWSELNGEAEAQTQGKSRLIERVELYKELINKLTK